MKNILLIAAALLVCVFAGRALVIAMASDETRITWLFEAEAEAFNSASVLSSLDHFAIDYRDETRNLDLQALRAIVLWTFRNRRDEAGRFLWRVDLPSAAGKVAVDGDTATADLPVRLLEENDAEPRLVWEIRVTAELERIDGDWQIVRSRHETIEGQAPGR